MALATSGTYNFQSIQVELMIREAFERIGILGEFVEPQKLDSARRSINFLLLEWMSKSVNLWTFEIAYLPLITAQTKYQLPCFLSDISQINLRTSTRRLNGTPASSAGVSANAFDGDPTTYCDAGVDGNISYDYGAGISMQINFIGMQPNNDTTDNPFTILIETSEDNINWRTLQQFLAVFTPGVTQWFDIIAPISARSYRARAIGGGSLELQELYFNNNILDMPISEVSRNEYLTYPNKQLQGRPCIYYVDRQIDPYLYIWPTPSSLYNCLQYSYKAMLEDCSAYTATLEIPSRFYPALVAGLSWKLAVKFNPNIAAMLEAEYEKSFNLASIEDSENTPIRIYGESNYEY